MVATTIYALCDPDLQVPVIRYIGKTGQNVAKRYKGHCFDSIRAKTRLGNWLRSLKARGEKPVLLTLTEVPNEIGSAAEILYIRLAREGGMDLVNTTDGGDGVTMTAEIREKISSSRLGESNPMFGKTGHSNPFFGQKHSEEQKAKWSRDRSGEKSPFWKVPLSKEKKARVSLAQRGRKSSTASSKYFGVCLHTRSNKWMARVWVCGRRIRLGYFVSEIDAAKAYDVAALRLLGPDVQINFPVTCCGPGT